MGCLRVTKKEFAIPMMDLANAYRKRFVLDVTDNETVKSSVLETWYSYFRDFDADILEMVVYEWIKRQKNPPAISDLLPKCRELFWEKDTDR